MRVLVKFSDLKKLQDKADWLKERYDDSNRKLDNAIKNEKSFQETIKNKDIEIIKLQCKLDEAADTAEEVKLLTAENNVLIEENNKLKTYAERKQPKFWFGDKVKIKNGSIFYIEYLKKEGNIFGYSSSKIDFYYEENYLELVDEDISK